jgi:hypothetical protein
MTLPCDFAGDLQRDVDRLPSAGVPGIPEWAGFLEDRQAGRDVDLEITVPSGDVPEFVLPHRLPAHVGGQAQQNPRLDVDDRHGCGEHQGQ